MICPLNRVCTLAFSPLTYNKLGGQQGLRAVMGGKWLRILETTQEVSVPDDSLGDFELRIFLENVFVSRTPKTYG